MSHYEGLGGTLIELPNSGDSVEQLADKIVLEVRKILGAKRRGEIDAANALRMMRREVAAVAAAQ